MSVVAYERGRAGVEGVAAWHPVGLDGRDGAPAQPFLSAASRAGGFVFVSGVIGVRSGPPGEVGPTWTPGELVEGGIEEQTRQALANLEATLVASGASFRDVVKVNAYLLDKDRDFAAFNQVYMETFPSNPPARTAIGATILGSDVLVEIECVAYVG